MENKTPIKIDMFEKILANSNDCLEKAITVLKNGGIIVYPTDTIYGFGCDAKDGEAIKRLNKIKGRSSPMSVLCPSLRRLPSWTTLNHDERVFVEKKLNPQTTIIVPVRDDVVSDLILGEETTLGIRISNHPFCVSIARSYSNPITTTSVNRSGNKPLSNPEEIESEFSNEIELCIDDGILDNEGSKIYKYQNKSWSLIRQ